MSHGVRNHTIKNFTAVFITASGLLLAGCSAAHHATKWEYKTMSNVSDRAINEMVEQGWSVAGFSEYATDGSTIRTSYLLKRPKQ